MKPPEQLIAEAVGMAQANDVPQNDIAAVLFSFAARYALQIGWQPDTVAEAQRFALAEHVAALRAKK